MKTTMKRAIRDETGAAVLALVLILLVVGGLVLTPLLGLMSTGLMAGQAYERHTDRLYAADAGVEDAIWRIQTHNLKFGTNNWSEPWHLTVNGKNVTVVVYREDLDPYCGEEFMYRILSAAAASDDGGGTAAIGTTTTVNASLDVLALNLSYMLDYAIVSNDVITIQPNVTVNGSVWLPDEGDPDTWNKGTITGDIEDSDDVLLTWPTADQLREYYWEDVKDLSSYPDDNINIEDLDPKVLGPLYRNGSLAIDNEGDPATLDLEGTVYVRGDLLEFEQSGSSKNYTIDLNGHTIFSEGEIRFPSHVVTVSGSGCIIAVGDIVFQPSVSSSPEDFVLVMSINGTVTVNPNGDFTGCIIGDEVVRLQPAQGEEFAVTWISPEGQELNFPGLNETDPDDLQITALTIESWEINPD